MTTDRIAALRKAAEEATPGEWKQGPSEEAPSVDDCQLYAMDKGVPRVVISGNRYFDGHPGSKDSEFCRVAKRDVPWLIDHAASLEAENERLRKALEFYGDPENWTRHGDTSTWAPVIKDDGDKARKALERKER